MTDKMYIIERLCDGRPGGGFDVWQRCGIVATLPTMAVAREYVASRRIRLESES